MSGIGFYGNDRETVWVNSKGYIWLVQSPDTAKFELLTEMPAGMQRLSSDVCQGITVPLPRDRAYLRRRERRRK